MNIKPIVAILAFALALPAVAQTLNKRLGRSFNDQPYEPITFFFDALNPEGVLQLSNVNGRCPNTDDSCVSDADCSVPGSVCGTDGSCLEAVTHLLGQISVIEKTKYCEIAACAGAIGGFLGAECNGITCPLGQTYCPIEGDCDSCALAKSLCLCNDGFTCPASDAALDPTWVAFDDTFDNASNPEHWSLFTASITGGPGDSQLRIGVSPAVDASLLDVVTDAAVRFPLTVGTRYVLTIKQGINPFVFSSTCDPYGQLAVFFSTRGTTCGVDADHDGFPAGVDCDDTRADVHPGVAEACNGRDDDCDGATDEDGAVACDDADRCTADACVAGACVHAAVSCDDGTLCTDDSCSPLLGCVNTPISCDDGISCTHDLCDPAVGCRNDPSSECPKGLGYYRHQCEGPSQSRHEPLTPGDAACVAQSDTFSWVGGVADICAVLDVDPRNDKCLQAEGQFMTLLLNRCKRRVADSGLISSTCGGNTTAGESVAEADALLSNPGRTRAMCTTAQCESEELNSGVAIGVQRLDVTRRLDGGVHLSWTAPPTCSPGTCVYRTWRRPSGVSTFVLIGEDRGTEFDDTSGVPGVDYQYVATFTP